jgi:hypothetical protein
MVVGDNQLPVKLWPSEKGSGHKCVAREIISLIMISDRVSPRPILVTLQHSELLVTSKCWKLWNISCPSVSSPACRT